MKFTNEELLQGIKDSDRAVLSFILTHIFPKVKSFLYKKGTQAEDNEDILMLSLEAIYTKIQNEPIVLANASFESYFTQICLNHWYKIIRRKKIHKRVTNQLPKVLKEEMQLDQYQIQQERFRLYEKKLHDLGDKCKQLLIYVLQLKLSGAEISKRLNISEGNVRKRKFDCKSKLIRLIKKDPLYQELCE